MRNVRSIIVSLLVLAQALVGAGLGPRALCRDPDGSVCIDSVLTPCCCHRVTAVRCCDDDQSAGACPDDEQGPRLSSACQCDCTPVSASPVVTHNDRTKAQEDRPQVDRAAVPVEIWRPSLPALRAPGLLNTGPPRLAVLDHLDSVILRL